MKNYSSAPTEENVIALLKEDSIGRNKDVFQFIKLLDAIDDGCAIALSGDWGSGKTFFVKQVKLILDSQNPQSVQSDEMRKTVSGLLPEDFSCCESYSTVYYDAWVNDNHTDPILSLMFASIRSGQSDFSPEKGRSLMHMAGGIVDTISGRNISSLLNAAEGEDVFAQLNQMANIHGQVREFIDGLIHERGNRLIIFIDELDRCKPDYAVRLLERIKHYFDDDRVIFVFSICLSQLQWTIKAYYGANFDATRYLDKFFDLHVSIPEVDYSLFSQRKMKFGMASYTYDNVCMQAARYYRFSIRELERYVRLIKIAAYEKAHSICRGGTKSEKAYEYSMTYVVPIAIAIKMHDFQKFEDFISGKDSDPMIDILASVDIDIQKEFLLSHGEITEEEKQRNPQDTRKVVSLSERIAEVYIALFHKIYNENERTQEIGDMRFSAETNRKIKRIVTLLSPISDYDFE